MVEDELTWRSSASIETIKRRAQMLKDIRAFFEARGVMEVETPVLSVFCTTDPHLQSFSTHHQNKPYYLNTSPEFAMKRLLAQFRQPIFQICKSFRVDESGPSHNPEFTLLEWYRPGFTLTQLMDELEQLINNLSSQSVDVQRESYQVLFERHAGFNPHLASAEQCRQCALDYQVEIPAGLEDDVDEWLDWLLTQLVLPALPKDQFSFVYDYPKSQCALAKLRINQHGVTVTARFELFFGELELANGFDELLDAKEQEKRFQDEIDQRQRQGLLMPEMDKRLLGALDFGLPDCCGVALGLDRFLMLLSDKKSISDVMVYPWPYC